MWPEVETAKLEGRRELVLSGSSHSKRIETDGGLDDAIYDLVNLNFLEISRTSLSSLADERIGNLQGLTNLVLHNNKLSAVPAGIGKLSGLKFLDLSSNLIESVPQEILQLQDLMTLDLRNNKLAELPDISAMVKLHELFFSGNDLKELPEGITNGEALQHLHTIVASHNKIEEVPEGMSSLPLLKHLDLSNNSISEVPSDLSQCPKMKELNLKNNSLKDRRFAKLVDQCLTKSVMDYLAAQYAKEMQSSDSAKKKSKKAKSAKSAGSDATEKIMDEIRVLNFHADSSDGLFVKTTDAVADVRPYIICCIVRHLNFQSSLNMFKRFISLQTKLHEGICDNRLACTIATHDLRNVKAPLVYDACNPKTIQLVPLGKQKAASAAQLIQVLRKEADEQRKEKKRSTLTGIHKYLDLLRDKAAYPFLIDGSGCVISFPPITNCENTKITRDTTDILIEVTSSKSMAVCKEAMDELLREMLLMDVGRSAGPVTPMSTVGAAPAGDAGAANDKSSAAVVTPSAGDSANPAEGSGMAAESAPAATDVSTEAGAAPATMSTEDENSAASGDRSAGPPVQHKLCLVVEQVRIVDSTGALKVVYPSKTDLQSSSYVVLRP